MTAPKFDDGREKNKSLEFSIKDGSANAIGSGISNYITPYALALGASDAIVGLLSSVPNLIGSFSQLFSFNLLRVNSRKKAILIGCLLQAFTWLPLLALGLVLFIGKDGALLSNQLSLPLLLIFIYSAMVVFGAIIQPLWSSWMRDLVGERIGEYFARRTKITNIFALISMLVAGFILDYTKGTSIFIGFAIIFGIAFITRLISVYYLSRKYEPKYEYNRDSYFSFVSFIERVTKSNYGKFTVYVSLMMLAVYVASPFFAVYQLKNLGLNYLVYTGLIITSTLSLIFLVPLWGKFTDRFGNLAALQISGYLIPLMPLLYLLTPITLKVSMPFTIVFLFIIEILSGFAWGGFNLASGNFVYQAVSREKMPLCVAYSNILQAIGIFIGAGFAGFLATWLDASSLSSMNIMGFVYPSILVLFLLSAIFRFGVSAWMLPKIHEVVEREKYEFKKIEHDLSPMHLWYYLHEHKTNGRLHKT